MDKPTLHSKPVREFFFWTGIVATFCYRVIVILNDYSPALAKASWYIGTIGFILYFLHRYEISEKRAKLIRELQLSDKIQKLEGLQEDDRQALEYILNTLKSTKEKWNYIFIFVISALALLLGVFLDFM